MAELRAPSTCRRTRPGASADRPHSPAAGRPQEAVNALKISIWSEDTAPAHVVLAEAYLKLGEYRRRRAPKLERALVARSGIG